MRTAMLAWAGRSVVSAIDRLSATEMKRSGIEVRKQTGTQSGRTGSGKYYTGNTARVYHDAVCCTADSGKE